MNYKIQEFIKNLSDDEMKVMFRTLGYDFTPRWNSKAGGNRNEFCTSEDTKEGRIIKNLIDMGCMCLTQNSPWETDENYYACTAKGKDVVAEVWRQKKEEETDKIKDFVIRICLISVCVAIVMIPDLMDRLKNDNGCKCRCTCFMAGEYRKVFHYMEDGSAYEVWLQPNYITDIMLQPGERVIEMPFLENGDIWKAHAWVSSTRGVDTQHFFITPLYPCLTTTFIIITDRRIYRLLLKSFNDTYMSQVKWDYPK